MSKISDMVTNAWEKRNGAIIFTTVSTDSVPNSIYATCVAWYGEDKILVANNYFDKTMKNIESGSTGSILFITEDNKAFQIKGSIQYYTSGDEFNDMKKWNPEKHPGYGVAVVAVEEIYSGAKKLL